MDSLIFHVLGLIIRVMCVKEIHMTLFKQDLKNFPLKKIIQNDWLLF